MAELNSLLGSGISLISQDDVRYDGTLFSINAVESQIVLQQVHNFGTEDRVTDPSKIVSGTVVIQDYVTFQSTDIKDLFVHETPVVEAPKEILPTPPVVKVQPVAKIPSENPRQNSGRGQQGQGRPRNQEQGQHNDNNQNRPARREPQVPSGPAAGTGEHLLKMRVKKNTDGGNTESMVVSGEFDIVASLGKFNKDEVLAKVAAENVVDADNKYKKDDFFDSLSNDTVSRSAEGLQPRRSQAEERNLNQDTFGAIALQSNSYRRGGYRGGGRGGGQGQGRGQGGGRAYDGEGGGRGGRGRGRGQGRGRGRGNPTPNPAL